MNEKMIAKLEAKGFNRWTKETSRGTIDRLYLNATACGLEVTYYNTGNVSSAHFDGERISNAEGRRMLSQKTYIDLKDDSIHSDYWNDTFKDIAQNLIDEATAEIEAEEKAENETAQAVEETEPKKWYAVMQNANDDDWSYGSADKEEAMRMVIARLEDYPEGYIAVIENDVCVEEIRQDDFDTVYCYASRIVKAHDWDACRDDIEHLMYWLDMKDEWDSADDMTSEDVIRKAGRKIGIDLV